MTSRTLTLAILVAMCLLGVTPIALGLHYGFHVGWMKTILFFLLGAVFGFIPLLGVYLHGPGPRKRSQLQTLVFACAPLVVGALAYIGWYCGHPKAVGIVAFAVLISAMLFYFLGRGASDGRSSEEGRTK